MIAVRVTAATAVRMGRGISRVVAFVIKSAMVRKEIQDWY